MLVAGVGPTTGTLQQITRTVPIVFAQGLDPVGNGFVRSLARPGGNASRIYAVRIRLERESGLSYSGRSRRKSRAWVSFVIWAGPAGVGQWAVIQAFASPMGVELSPIDMRVTGDTGRDVADFAVRSEWRPDRGSGRGRDDTTRSGRRTRSAAWDGLRALGYIEGQNIVIEQRYAAGALQRLGPLAEELVRLNMDVIVVDGSATAKAVKAATSTIPVVFSLATDPVAEQLVSSMARPGANLTGLTMSVGYQLAGKRVELLKDIKPSLSRLAMLAQPDNTTARAYLQDTETVSRALGISTRTFEARTADDLPRAFAAMVEWQADGVVTLADALLFSQRERIVTLAINHKLPGVHPEVEFPLAGGLLSYGPSLADLFRRSASYVDKIVKGTPPAQLPIEQPSKLELVVNLKTAQSLGLTISRDFLLRADEVIE